jgi:predicted Rossmann fold flavoprotein
MEIYDVAVIGAGAAGTIAAIEAAKKNKTIIIDQNHKIGKKIYATGNGKCNYTNKNISLENYHGQNVNFAKFTLNNFNNIKTIDFFKNAGVLSKDIDERVYPVTEESASIVEILEYLLKENDVELLLGYKIHKINIENDSFIISSNHKQVKAKKLIIATGGKSSPNHGSDGEMFNIIKDLGHTITPLKPALVQIKTDNKFSKEVKGVRIKGSITIKHRKKEVTKDTGEIMFTDYGLSGIPVMQVSHFTHDYLEKNEKIFASLDFFPEMNQKDLDDLLIKRKNSLKERKIKDFLKGLIHSKLINMVLIKSGIKNHNSSSSKLTEKDISSLSKNLKDLSFFITGTKSWKNSQVTFGGIDTSEIDEKTMESKVIKNLYFAGEIIDISGDCGGYNLQWAWSSGYIAGKSTWK